MSVFPEDNLEVLGNTEHENKKIFAGALAPRDSGRAAPRGGGCVVRARLSTHGAVAQLTRVSWARSVPTSALNVPGRPNRIACFIKSDALRGGNVGAVSERRRFSSRVEG